jgi:hypothetical protein
MRVSASGDQALALCEIRVTASDREPVTITVGDLWTSGSDTLRLCWHIGHIGITEQPEVVQQ